METNPKMKKQYIHLVYSSPHTKLRSSVAAVIYTKGVRHTAFLNEASDNTGPSLTNSIEYAVIELSKKLGNHPENIQVFQLDFDRDAYDLVVFKDGNPDWSSFDNEILVTMLGDWLSLTDEEEAAFTK